MPNAETVTILPDTLYHILPDQRIWRKPERIETLLLNVVEVRTARERRRDALSQWQEGERQLHGYAIIGPDGSLYTMHVIRDSEFRRRRQRGQGLWPT